MSIVVIDDHAKFRDSLCDLIDQEVDMEIVGCAGHGSDVLALVRVRQPDVLVLDIGPPASDGIALTRRISNACPRTRVIGVSAHAERHFIAEMLRAGAAGYLCKESAAAELLCALRSVATGRNYLCGAATAALLAPGADEPATAALGRRELQVLRLLAEGICSLDIATRLFIAPGTVDVHLRNIMRKLNLHTAAELTGWALRHGLIEP